MRRVWIGIVAAMAACSDGKSEVSEDFADLAAVDQKSDYFSYRLKLLGTLRDDDERTTRYSRTPRFRGWDFFADAGDTVDVRVRSRYGDPVAWLLDAEFDVIAKNDDESADSYDSRIQVTLPASAGRRYYVVFRDYDLASHRFTLEFTRTPAASDWESRVKAWFAGRFVGADYDAARQEFVVEPDALQGAAAARFDFLSAARPGSAVGWIFEAEGGEGFAVFAVWDERFFVDLVGLDAGWFAHGHGGFSDGRVEGIDWDPDDNDPTMCSCDGGSSSAVCTWLDGSSFYSGSILCD